MLLIFIYDPSMLVQCIACKERLREWSNSVVVCRPVALCHVVTGPGKVDVTTYGASVEVSDKLKGLGLHDRYSSR